MGNSLGQMFLQGGWVMWPLLVFSIVTWAVVLERAFVFLTIKPKLAKLAQSVMDTVRTSGKSREQAERTVEINRARMMGQLKQNLWILGTIGSASPFLGLLGTVIGIVRAFHNMAQTGSGGLAVVGAGISEALIATAFGLIVAIIALLTYNVFVTAANQTLGSFKISLEESLEAAFDSQTRAKA